MKRIILVGGAIALLAAIILLVAAFFLIPTKRNLSLSCPSGEGHITGLTFKGSTSNPLDGSLRLLWIRPEGTVGDKHQTNLKMDSTTRMEWLSQKSPPSFVVLSGTKPVMVWKLEAGKMVCTEGTSYVVADPYETSQTPSPKSD